MTASVSIGRAKGDAPYRVAVYRQEPHGQETFLFEIKPGEVYVQQAVWKGSAIVIREIE